MEALYKLEAAGILLMSTLDSYTEQIQNALNLIPESDDPNADTLLKCWLSNPEGVSPTWKNFLQITNQLGLEDLTQQIETCLTSATQVEQLPEVQGTDLIIAEGEIFGN